MASKKKHEIVVNKSWSLDTIEEKMIECMNVNETSKIFLAAQKFDMLQKFAAFKIRRAEIDALKEGPNARANEPLEVVYVDSNTESEKKRIEKIENSVREARGIKEDA